MLKHFRKRTVHPKSNGIFDVLSRIFLIELFADFFKETEGSVDFEGTISQTNINDVLTLDDVIGVSKWIWNYS